MNCKNLISFQKKKKKKRKEYPLDLNDETFSGD